MSILDFILLFILAFVTSLGFFFGLVRVLGAFATIIISVVIAGSFFKDLSKLLEPYLLNNLNLSRVIAFIVIYWFSSFFISLCIKIVDKLFNLPVIKAVNRILGAVFSLVASILIISLFFFLISTYAWGEPLLKLLKSSSLIPYLILIGKFVSQIVPGL